AVAAIVIDAGGSEDAAIAALLHDAVEDQPALSGGVQGIRDRFGALVAKIVEGCSDTDPSGGSRRDASNWRVRKQAYLDALSKKPADVLLVALADKVHNLRAIRIDLALNGEDVWARFNAPKEDQLWYYGELVAKFRVLLPGPLVDD